MNEAQIIKVQKFLRENPKPGKRNWPVIVQNKNSSEIRVISTIRKGMVNYERRIV